MNASEHGRPDAVIVMLQSGGLPPGELMFCTAGQQRWTRVTSADGEIIEDEDVFIARCKAGARDVGGVRLIHISSFPADPDQMAISHLVEAWHWAHDDGVPPEEEGPIRRRGF